MIKKLTKMLNGLTQDVEKQTKKVLQFCENKGLITESGLVGIFALCKTLGIKIVPINYNNPDGEYCAHLISRCGKATYIFVDAKAPIQRMRFDAATLIYGMLSSKNKGDFVIAKSKHNKKLHTHKKFASMLLMPTKQLKSILFERDENGEYKYLQKKGSAYEVIPAAIHKIADRFGVEYSKCAKRIFYGEDIDVKIAGVKTKQDLKELVATSVASQETRKQQVPDCAKNDLELKRCLINNMYYPAIDTADDLVKEKFRLETVKNDCKIEGVVKNVRTIETFLSKYRLNPEKYIAQIDNLTEEQRIMIGHYETIRQLEEYQVGRYIFTDLYKGIFRYSQTAVPGYRVGANIINGANFETDPAESIIGVIENLSLDIADLLRDSKNLTNTEYIQRANYITQRFLICHPFEDGNGRVSRLITNYLLIHRGLVPVFINASKKHKDRYIKVLKQLSDSARYSSMWDFKSPELNDIIYDCLIASLGEFYPADMILTNTNNLLKDNRLS